MCWFSSVDEGFSLPSMLCNEFEGLAYLEKELIFPLFPLLVWDCPLLFSDGTVNRIVMEVD